MPVKLFLSINYTYSGSQVVDHELQEDYRVIFKFSFFFLVNQNQSTLF